MGGIFGDVWQILIGLIIFGVLVISHEWGHFIVAKKQGVLVEEFSVGMGPAIWKKQKGDTLYSVRVLPMGGYCKMKGENEETDDPRDFNNKSVLSRIKILVAGPFMNFVVSFALIMILTSMEGYISTQINSVSEGFAAAEVGIKKGDIITSINGKKVFLYEDINAILMGNNDKPVEITVNRQGENINYILNPKFSEETGKYLLGFTPSYKPGIFSEDYNGYNKAGVFDTIVVSFHTMVYYIKATAQGFIGLFNRTVSPDDMTGAIGIVQVIGESYEAGLQYSVKAAVENVMYIGALLSANLGIINLFPLPALDGGRLLFFIIEAIRGRALDRQIEGVIHFCGFVALFGLMIFLAFNDISKLI